jgi:hypothetical protein
MNNFDSKKYYTVTPVNPNEASWQPDAITNNKIHLESGITSNWKYRQYIQNNANHIMKYNSMEYINASGNNPYFDQAEPSAKQGEPSANVPYRFTSLHDPSYRFSDSDLKQDFLKRQQMSSRMISPAYATINPK